MLVVVVAAVEVVVIAGGVVDKRELVLLQAVESCRRYTAADIVYVCPVGREFKFLIGVKTVETDILSQTGTGIIVERICERILRRHSTPDCLFEILVVAVVRDAVLIALQTVFENIFRNLTEVQIQVAAFKIVVFRVEERIKQPELDIFDVALLKVRIVHLAHYTAPALLWIEKTTVAAYVGVVEVVGTALVGIVRQIESLNGIRLTVCRFASRENLADSDLADIRIRELL